MKNIIIIVFVVCITLSQQSHSQEKTYAKTYAKKYQSAISFVKENKVKIKNIAEKYQVEAGLLIAIAFPEIVRYSSISNMIETTSLELLYTRFGKNYANFSIGRFQMKPSFIESLEENIEKYKLKSINSISKYKQKQEKEIRKERIRRLKDLSWQLKYLAGFCKVIEKKFKGNWTNKTSKIRFFASAYNRGFENSAIEIKRWSKIKAFPHGLNRGNNQFSYSSIAWNFYQKYVKTIFKN